MDYFVIGLCFGAGVVLLYVYIKMVFCSLFCEGNSLWRSMALSFFEIVRCRVPRRGGGSGGGCGQYGVDGFDGSDEAMRVVDEQVERALSQILGKK